MFDKNFKKRNNLFYKMKLWLYRVTFWDIVLDVKKFCLFLFEIIITLLGFLLIFIGPHIFH